MRPLYRQHWQRSKQVFCGGMIVDESGNDIVLGRWIGGYYQWNGRWYYEKPHCSVFGHKHDGVTPYCEQCGTKIYLEEGQNGR